MTKTVATFSNTEDRTLVTVFVCEAGYRVSIADAETGEILPSFKTFSTKTAALAFAAKCVA